MSQRPSSFQNLALWTTAATYVLILVGGLVRASGAGLGCPDWPRCFGSWVPPMSAEDLPAQFDASQFNPALMWTEYLNRVLGVTVGLLIFATLVSAVRHHRNTARILWPTLAAFLLVGFEGWLGGVVVKHELAAWIVTVHLLVALVIVSLLLYATFGAFAGSVGSIATSGGPDDSTAAGKPVTARRAVAWSTLALLSITVSQIALGAQVRGRIDDAMAQGVPRAQALARVGAVDGWHREVAALVMAATLLVGLQVWSGHRQNRPLARAAYLMCGLVGLQVVFGITMAYGALTPAVQIAHLSASSLLLGAETVVFLLARRLPSP